MREKTGLALGKLFSTMFIPHYGFYGYFLGKSHFTIYDGTYSVAYHVNKNNINY